jgi:plasmid stability protein
MSKMIQIRDVPDDLHRELKTRAARQSMSLSDYLKRELAALAERPTLDEWFDRVSKREPIEVSAQTIVDIIRAHRDA